MIAGSSDSGSLPLTMIRPAGGSDFRQPVSSNAASTMQQADSKPGKPDQRLPTSDFCPRTLPFCFSRRALVGGIMTRGYFGGVVAGGADASVVGAVAGVAGAGVGIVIKLVLGGATVVGVAAL